MAPRLPPKALGRPRQVSACHDASSELLDAFMGFVATFFHGPLKPRQTGYQPALGFFRYGHAGRRQFHASRRLAKDDVAHEHPPRTRGFHNYFVTHLPSSSLHPDSRSTAGPHHKLPREASTPHTPGVGSPPAVTPPNMPSRDLTVVRIPLRSAKHHFGAFSGRGTRKYNEDTNQAGTIDIPAFAKRAPMSLSRDPKTKGVTTADSSFGDPQIFYFGVFDGHGGSECSEFLRDELHGYIEEAAGEFELGSSLRIAHTPRRAQPERVESADILGSKPEASAQMALDQVQMKSAEEVEDEANLPERRNGSVVEEATQNRPLESTEPVAVKADVPKAIQLERALLQQYKDTVGGYFRRFKPAHFDLEVDPELEESTEDLVTIESVLTYAFLRADLDFITAQARKPDPDDPYISDFPLNNDEILGDPHHPPSGHGIGGARRFKGGSTASIVLVSTPTPAPFWHPAAHSTIVVAHVGDTRVLLCETATGLARPLTSDHHPSSPAETRRLTRFAESLVTDSFGEERISGLANSRAFGDMNSKRIGVSAEPELVRIDLEPAQYSFLVLMSDGVSGTLSDQEIVDVIKEARTPEQGARDVVEYANEVSTDGDNATCLVVRLGGWERRSEGGLGSLGTKEIRDIRRSEALDPRRGRR